MLDPPPHPPQDWAKVPALDDMASSGLIRRLNVAERARSTTRYVAKVTYVFNADAVRRSSAAPTSPIPMCRRGPFWFCRWAGLCAAFAMGGGVERSEIRASAVPLVTPSGDAAMASRCRRCNFDRFVERCRAIAARMHASEACWRRPSAARPRHIETDKMTAKSQIGLNGSARRDADEDSVACRWPARRKPIGAAADAAVRLQSWKSRIGGRFRRGRSLTVEVKISSCRMGPCRRLAAIPNVSGCAGRGDEYRRGARRRSPMRARPISCTISWRRRARSHQSGRRLAVMSYAPRPDASADPSSP